MLVNTQWFYEKTTYLTSMNFKFRGFRIINTIHNYINDFQLILMKTWYMKGIKRIILVVWMAIPLNFIVHCNTNIVMLTCWHDDLFDWYSWSRLVFESVRWNFNYKTQRTCNLWKHLTNSRLLMFSFLKEAGWSTNYSSGLCSKW